MIQAIYKNKEKIHEISFHGIIPSKKNSKQIVCRGRRPILLPSKSFTNWHLICSQTLKMPPISDIMTIEVNMYDKLKKDGTEPKRRFDLTNKAESIMDFLVDMKIIEDDNYKYIPQIILTFGGYRDICGAEVYIYTNQ